MKMVSPRYCKENYRHLNSGKIKELAFPMSCFCDIGLQKLEEHMSFYGYYGIAFPKEWCMARDFQGVQYLNQNSSLISDVRKAVNSAFRLLDKQTKETQVLSDFLLNQLMYYKPYQGQLESRVDKKKHYKCFADECEWRFIPDARVLGMEMVVREQWQMDNMLNTYNAALAGRPEVSVRFDYQDLKYVLVENVEGFNLLVDALEKDEKKGQIDEHEVRLLLSKVLVWDEIKGDF